MKSSVFSRIISSLRFSTVVLVAVSLFLTLLFWEVKFLEKLSVDDSQEVPLRLSEEEQNENLQQTIPDEAIRSPSSTEEDTTGLFVQTEPIDTHPLSFDLLVPFILQAPYSYWGQPYQEACEEASLLMAAKYFDGEQEITKEAADTDILQLVAWEKEYFGFYEDTDTEETAQAARLYFQMNADVVTDVSVDRIKDELLKGHLVLAPLTGRELQNPYFRGQGPLYHMVVIRGVDDTSQEFITNDPGIGRGKGYRYKYDIIMKSIHDWNGGDIYNGEPKLISVWK